MRRNAVPLRLTVRRCARTDQQSTERGRLRRALLTDASAVGTQDEGRIRCRTSKVDLGTLPALRDHGLAPLDTAYAVSPTLAAWVTAPSDAHGSYAAQLRPTSPHGRRVSTSGHKKSRCFQRLRKSPLTDSNRRPLPYHGSALPTELRGRECLATCILLEFGDMQLCSVCRARYCTATALRTCRPALDSPHSGSGLGLHAEHRPAVVQPRHVYSRGPGSQCRRRQRGVALNRRLLRVLEHVAGGSRGSWGRRVSRGPSP
jgi:hypothetical protein